MNSVDTKPERAGRNFKPSGLMTAEGHAARGDGRMISPTGVEFMSIPKQRHDMLRNEDCVSVGWDHDTWISLWF